MSGRLIIGIVSTLLEISAIAFGILWGLPKIGIDFPLWLSILIAVVLMAVWLAYSVFTYHKGTLALTRGCIIGMPDMIGTEGVVVSRLAPAGMVRIRSELWIAKSAEGEIEQGEKVTVIEQERLKLMVRRTEISNQK